MTARGIVALSVVLFTIPALAQAGAWTLPEGTTQIIATTTLSDATRSFDANGNADEDLSFRKLFVSVYSEYGLKDWLTLVAVPEFADATSAAPGRATQKADDFALSGGVRVRLFDSGGVFSVQATARSAGAFELDTSADEDPGEDFEVRALYGTHFEAFDRDGCFDVQIAQRWATGGRPNETPVDLTMLYDIGWSSEAMLQSFNIVSEGGGRAPFSYYRYHKVALSVVRPVWGDVSLQLGGFASPAGQNALKEQGLFVALWAKF